MSRRRLYVLRLVLVLSVPLLLGAGGDDFDTRISQVALAYAQGFEPLLRSDRTEAVRFGVAADDLAHLEVVTVRRLHSVDSQFQGADDDRAVDEALVPTDLWWVLLSVESRPRLVVSVEWADGAADPQAVGLNWVPAGALASALVRVDSGRTRVVYLPEDASVAIGEVDGIAMVMAIADEQLTARLELPSRPVPVDDYTHSLRERLDRLSQQTEDAAPGLGGGAAQSPTGSTLSALVLLVLLIPLGVLALSACMPLRELPRLLPGRDRPR